MDQTQRVDLLEQIADIDHNMALHVAKNTAGLMARDIQFVVYLAALHAHQEADSR